MASSSLPQPAAESHAGPLDRLLNPRSLAIVGASADPRSFGGFVLGNLRRFGWQGALHLVSRSSTEIDGHPCVKTVQELPEDLDLAVLAIPEAGVLEAVQALAARRCAAAVLFASGYAETGAEGQQRQQALVAAAGAMRLVGPNCMGFTHFEHGVPITFEPVEPHPCGGRPGLAVVAQSGFMAATLRDAFLGRGLPLVAVFSTGNEASVSAEDLIGHYLADPQVRVIVVYAEQLRHPARFLARAREARAAGKPIVLLMPGRSERARQAAQSHTGALAGDHATAQAALQREAVVTVDTLDELFDTAAILLRHPVPPEGGTAFVTGSGAMKNIALDLAADIGLPLPDFAADTVTTLRSQLPAYAVAENPLDYTTIGVRQPGLIGEILDTVAADPGIGSLVLAIPVGPAIAQRDKAEHIVPALARNPKPTVLVLTGDAGPVEPFFLQAVQAAGVPLFRSSDRALRALARVARHARALARARRADERPPTGTPLALPGPVPANGTYAEYQGKQWLTAAGIAVPRSALARHADEAAALARDLGGPVVLKAQASALPHKSDVGGVRVGVQGDAAVREAYAQMVASVARHRPELALDGVLVEALGARGLELVVGAKRDADWGPVVLVGLGGIWIEALKDVRLLSADLHPADVVDELGQLKAAAVLRGLRGAPPVNLDAIAQVVCAIGQQMRADPRVIEIDINPLVATPDGVVALDALLVVQPPA